MILIELPLMSRAARSVTCVIHNKNYLEDVVNNNIWGGPRITMSFPPPARAPIAL